MATISKRKNKDGSYSYKVNIRKNGLEISKTFYNEEDAKLYEFYKERLLNNIENFEVPIGRRLTIRQLLELKLKTFDSSDVRMINDYKIAIQRIMSVLGDKFYHEYSYSDWENAAKKLLEITVYKGAKTDNGKRVISPESVRKIFAYISSSVSYAQSQGVELENHAMKVIRVLLLPLIKGS